MEHISSNKSLRKIEAYAKIVLCIETSINKLQMKTCNKMIKQFNILFDDSSLTEVLTNIYKDKNNYLSN